MIPRLSIFLYLTILPSQAALIVIDQFSGSYLNREIAYPGGTLTISITGDTNDSFLSVVTGNATSVFHKSAIMLADSDAGTTNFNLSFSTPVSSLAITFTDVDRDVNSTFANPTPNDVLVANLFTGNARALGFGSNAPVISPSGFTSSNINVVGAFVNAVNSGTSAIVRFEFESPQTQVRINYQNGAGGGASGGVGVTEIRFEAIPEPSAPILFALSSLALFRRRR